MGNGNNVFLTGANGYVGSVVAERLRASGYRVVGLARGPEKAEQLRRAGITPLLGDLRDLAPLQKAARDADAVVHVAFNMTDLSVLEESVAIERTAVAALADALTDSGKALVVTTGTAVLGDTAGTLFDETTPVPPNPTAIGGRLETEQLVLAAARRGVRAVVLRLPNLYGRDGGPSLLPALARATKAAGVSRIVAGTADHRWSFSHVDDVADLHVLAVEKAAAGELFHAAAETSVRTGDLAAALARVAGVPAPVEEVPVEELAKTLGVLGYYWAINSQSTGEKARQRLGWQPQHTDLLAELTDGRWNPL